MLGEPIKTEEQPDGSIKKTYLGKSGREFIVTEVPFTNAAVGNNEKVRVRPASQQITNLAQNYLGNTKGQADLRKMLDEIVTTKIGKKGKWLTKKLFELIEGVHLADVVKEVNGKKKVVTCYQKEPNLNAIIYALDRVLGKPKQFQVQASFSLSQLLKDSEMSNSNFEDNNLGNGSADGQTNNFEDAEGPPVFYAGDVESDTAAH